MVCSRTMDAMQAKVPQPKMAYSATFSRRGRWIDANVLSGSTRIQMSVAMLKPEVASAQDS